MGKLLSSKQVNADAGLAKKVYMARTKEKLSYNALEDKFGLKKNNGMVAYRIVKSYEAGLKKGKKKK